MEITLSKRGDVIVLGVRGKIRLQNWRVLDRHLDVLLERGHRLVAMDLSEVSLICSTGIGSLMHNLRKFQERDASLMLLSTTPYVRDIFRIFGCEEAVGDRVFEDWPALEKRLPS